MSTHVRLPCAVPQTSWLGPSPEPKTLQRFTCERYGQTSTLRRSSRARRLGWQHARAPSSRCYGVALAPLLGPGLPTKLFAPPSTPCPPFIVGGSRTPRERERSSTPAKQLR
jgi:hypothetical protein